MEQTKMKLIIKHFVHIEIAKYGKIDAARKLVKEFSFNKDDLKEFGFDNYTIETVIK